MIDQPVSRFKERFFKDNPVRRHILSNGLTILTQENHELPITSLYTIFRVGSRNERPGITGISHLFEHMMFNGSRKFGPKEFDRILEAGGGYSNAYTSRDLTVYYEDFASPLLKTVIDLDSDRMGWLNLSAKSLKSEREVVKEERMLRTDDSILGRLEEELLAASYQAHPYRWPIIGWMSDIENISLKDCNNYFKKYYSPNNAVIVLSGDFDTKNALDLFEEYYGSIPSRKIPAEPITEEPPQKGEKRIQYSKQTELDVLMIGYHVPSIMHKDIYALDILQTILTEGESSLLHKTLVREKGLALYLYSDFSWYIDPGLYIYIMQMKPGNSVHKGEAALEKELNKYKKMGFSKAEINRAKNILEADFHYGLQTNSGRAHRFGLTEVMNGDFEKLFDPLEEYRKITEDDVIRVLKKYFVSDNKTIVWLK